MKSKTLVIGIILSTILLGGIMMTWRNHKPIESIKMFRFSYTVSMMMNGYVSYSIECNDKCIQQVKKLGEEEAEEKIISKERVKELEELLNKYNVSSWNGFNKSDNRVLDGRDFNLSIRLESGESISASGYMMWPKNFHEVEEELKKFFEE